MTLLSIKNLSLSFGQTQILRNVSFEVKKGEMLAVVGESGSGKSLTALSCLGLQPANALVSGNIIFDGEVLLNNGGQQADEPSAVPHASVSRPAMGTFKKIRGRKASMVFQEPMTSLNPLHTIGQQIGEMWRNGTGEIRNLERRELEKKGTEELDNDARFPNSRFLNSKVPDSSISELLEKVGLEKFKNRLNAYPHELSGGERQRVMIAMAIANNPALLIADEPTTAVDVTIQAKILKLLKELQQSLDMGMMFITHDLTIVRKLADRVVVMKKGEVVEQGLVSEVFANPKHEYTKLLINSEPKGVPLPVPAGAKTIMECRSLKVHYPIKSGFLKRVSGYVKAADDISITIPESSTLGIVGESGSGKTTLGFALLRLIKSEGKILFLGQEIDKLKTRALRPLRSQMQLVFQDPYSSLNPRMQIRDIIAEGLLVHYPHKTVDEREQEIDKILSEVGLDTNVKNRYPHEFSGGQRQRISIARAMVLRPKLVVLDEPTSALDLTVQAQIIELLKHFQKERGTAYLFISHDLRVIRAIAQNIIVMKNGKIVEQGTTQKIFSSPKHEYTKNLIEAAFLSS